MAAFDDLITAFTILNRYADGYVGTHCEHDVLMVTGVEPDSVTREDTKRLDELGFHISTEHGDAMFASFRWGSS